jgi:hypothetical protein
MKKIATLLVFAFISIILPAQIEIIRDGKPLGRIVADLNH